MIACKYCNKKYTNKYILKTHQNTSKKCLIIQYDIEPIPKQNAFICKGCQKFFCSKRSLLKHNTRCLFYNTLLIKEEYEEKINILMEKTKELKKKHIDDINNINTKNSNVLYNLTTEKKKEILKVQTLTHKMIKLENRIEEITNMAIQRPFENETYVDIDPVCKEDNNSDCEIEEYKLSPLDIGEGYDIKHRDEDGYINVTNLCKAGGKQFKHWKSIQKTKTFLRVLSRSVGIPTDLLIKYNSTGLNENRSTWVHPQIAINIAQWISNIFDVKVSSWVYEAMMTGKVDIANTKTYKEIQKENKTKDIRIRFLEKKYLKCHSRIKYKEKYVIYILTTRLMQKERRYIMGKATDLTNRLSTYNKSDEHRVVYYQGCGDEETMSVVENVVFLHLHKYREQANRERFILPEDEEINLFSNIIKKSIEYCKKPDMEKI
jgi:hypothetical protein